MVRSISPPRPRAGTAFVPRGDAVSAFFSSKKEIKEMKRIFMATVLALVGLLAQAQSTSLISYQMLCLD